MKHQNPQHIGRGSPASLTLSVGPTYPLLLSSVSTTTAPCLLQLIFIIKLTAAPTFIVVSFSFQMKVSISFEKWRGSSSVYYMNISMYAFIKLVMRLALQLIHY